MFLRTKTFIIISIVFIVAFILLAAILSILVNRSYRQEEERDVQDKTELIRLLIDDSLRGLEQVALDWAEWDETYAFIEDKNQAYINSYMQDINFFNNRWNLVIMLNGSHEVIFSKAFDLMEGTAIAVPENMNNFINPGGVLSTNLDTDNIKGIITLTETPMLVVSHPILTNQGTGPRRGTFILGRNLDALELERLTNITNLTLKIYVPKEETWPVEIQSIYSQLQQGSSFVAQPLNDDMMAGFCLFYDINNNPALIVEVNILRTLYSQSRTAIIFFSLSLLAFGLIFVLAILLLLDKMVLSRIASLSQSVTSIAQTGDPASRIGVCGKDEISSLAANINNMLDSLEHYIKLRRESDEFNSSLLNNAPYPILVSNPDNSIRYVNPAFEKVTGFSLPEISGRTIPYPWWPKEKIEQYLNSFEKQNDQPYQGEMMLRRKTGEVFWINMNHTPVKDGDNVSFYLSIWMDITSQKLAREELERLYQREKNVTEQLQVEIKSRTEFTRALVHELKTPLTPILASSELLVEELTEEPLLGLAKNVHRGAENMNKRVDELLDLARGEVGLLKINLKPVDLGKLLREVFNNMEPVVRSSGQSLTLEIENDLPVTLADDDRIRQVLLNLINNATKYSSSGGKISIKACIEGSNIVIEIQDTGRGISDEEQKNLFKPYYRIEGKERLSGLGLGLTLSKNLVELHGGRIWVSSKKGTGSTFAFSLPLRTRIQPGEEALSGGQ